MTLPQIQTQINNQTAKIKEQQQALLDSQKELSLLLEQKQIIEKAAIISITSENNREVRYSILDLPEVQNVQIVTIKFIYLMTSQAPTTRSL